MTQPNAPTKIDAKFTGDIFKVKDGTRVPDDQYVVFLVKDNVFARDALPAYIKGCEESGCDAEQLAAVRAMFDRVLAWRSANAALCKDPDAHGERLLAL